MHFLGHLTAWLRSWGPVLHQTRGNQLHQIPKPVSHMRPGMIYLYFGGVGHWQTRSSRAPPISALGVKLRMAYLNDEKYTLSMLVPTIRPVLPAGWLTYMSPEQASFSPTNRLGIWTENTRHTELSVISWCLRFLFSTSTDIGHSINSWLHNRLDCNPTSIPVIIVSLKVASFGAEE